MKWKVTEKGFRHETVHGVLNNWWAAHRLVKGITGYDDNDIANTATMYNRDFTVPWYKVDLIVERVEEDEV